MIIGTAGHIDHGKTSLVRALTGVDADRLPEEKARGITIELGFAYVTTDHGEMLGFVDVPGHEKFVHTMAAGAAGMDHGLLVIAADDGIMPQTREHLRILDLLGLPSITVAITKTDLVDSEQLARVRESVLEEIGCTRFGLPKIFPVSTHHGEGIEALKAELFSLNRFIPEDQPLYFRLAIDRVFVVKGLGVAVTGAVMSGRVNIGETLRLACSNRTVKVRSIHAQNTPAEFAEVGTRCGIVLTGVELSDVQRGDWLVAPEVSRLTSRVDCLLTMPDDSSRSVRDGELVLLHHGCEQVSARLILLNASELSAGEMVFAQCVLERSLPICWDDRMVLRDGSARTTLAGARALDINPPVRNRKKPERIAQLALLNQEDALRAVSSLLAHTVYPLNLTEWSESMNRSVQSVSEALTAQIAGRYQLSQALFVETHTAEDSLLKRLTQSLFDFHLSDPDEPGLALERLRRISVPDMPKPIFMAWMSARIEQGYFSMLGSFVHLPDHRVVLNAPELLMWEKIYPRLLEGGFDPPWVRDLSTALSLAEDAVRSLLKKQARQSLLTQLVKDLFYPQATMIKMSNMLRDIVAENGFVSVVAFRDRLGIGRKRAIQVLEACDRIGLTRRLVTSNRLSRAVDKDHRILRNAELFKTGQED